MMQFKMKPLLDKTKIEYIITRSSQTLVNGMPVNSIEPFNTYLTVTNAKKEDMDSIGTGNHLGSLLKVRILIEEINQIKLGDKFEFDNDTYEVTRKRPYQNGTADFRIFYAGLEGS